MMRSVSGGGAPASGGGPPIVPKRETYDNKPAALKMEMDAIPTLPAEVSKADWNRRLLEVQEQMRQLSEQIRILVEESAARKKRKLESRGKTNSFI